MKFRESQRELEAAVLEFVENYHTYIAEAEERLGDLFDQNDYPPIDEIKGKFQLDSDFERVDIPEHEQKRIREQIEGRVEVQHAQAMKRVWNRIFKAVEHMNERLSQEDGIFRNTLVENIEQLVDVLPSLNVLEDQTLADMTTELKDTLCGYKPDDLRKDDVLRKELADRSKEVMDKISKVEGLFGTPPEQDVMTEPNEPSEVESNQEAAA